MARSRISGREIDLQADNGAVLWSFIQGERLVYNITFDWIDNIHGMTVEAVVIEAKNNPGELPSEVLPAGAQDKLIVFQPAYKGEWASGATYAQRDLVHISLDDKYYQCINPGISTLPPGLDTAMWKEYGSNNTVSLLFPETLSVNYAVKPLPDKPIYGYFELSLMEAGAPYNRNWKPMRGLVEFLFSPTHLVP